MIFDNSWVDENIDNLVKRYIRENEDSLINDEILNTYDLSIYEDDLDLTEEQIEDGYESLDDEQKEELEEIIKDNLYNYESSSYQFAQDEVYKKLDEIYQHNLEEFDDCMSDIVSILRDYFEEKGYDLHANVDYNYSHSYSGGRFTSQYWDLYVEDDESSEMITIRMSDGHDNGRDSKDVEINGFQDSYYFISDIVDNIYMLLDNYDIEYDEVLERIKERLKKVKFEEI